MAKEKSSRQAGTACAAKASGAQPPPPTKRHPRRHSADIPPQPKTDDLTSREQDFVAVFVETGCPAKAAREAGYANPSRDGKRALERRAIKDAIAAAVAAQNNRTAHFAKLSTAAAAGDQLKTLMMLRNNLAEAIEATRGAVGKAQLSKELREVLAQIAELEKAKDAREGTGLDKVKKARAARGKPRAKT